MRLIVLAMVVLPRIVHADCHPAADDAKLHATFKPETTLADLGAWIGGITCKNVVFDSALATRTVKVTVLAPGELTPKQALQLFVDSLAAVGLSVSASADSYIVRAKDGCGGRLEVSPLPDPVMDKLVHEIDDTHAELNMTAAGIKEAEVINQLQRGARIVPSIKDGKPNGFKLYAIRPGSLYARIHLQNGDNVIAINGFDVPTPEKMLAAYTKLRDATSYTIEIIRRGNPLQLHVVRK